jgi:hypothetical protein
MQMWKNMLPEQARMYASMAQGMHGPAAQAGAQRGASRVAAASAAAVDPAAAADIFKNLSPQQLEEMTKAAAASGMMPEGANISPEALQVPCCLVVASCSNEALRYLRMLTYHGSQVCGIAR